MPTLPARAPAKKHADFRPLKGTRILSLALNLPGPAALMRCRDMGATCIKLEPPAPSGPSAMGSGDPMWLYNPAAYEEMHRGLRVMAADLKTEKGQTALHKELAKADVLLTSFRPSALKNWGCNGLCCASNIPAYPWSPLSAAPAPGPKNPAMT